MSRYKHRYYKEWCTDDEKFSIQMTLKSNDYNELPLLDLSILYMSDRPGLRKLLKAFENVAVNEDIILEGLEKNDGFYLEGILTYNEVQTENGGRAVAVQGDLKFGNGLPYDFMGALLVHNLKGECQDADDNGCAIIEIDEECESNDQIPSVLSPDFEDLFPYVHMNHWPGLTDEQIKLNFVPYQPPDISNLTCNFYNELQHKTRAEILDEADLFLENKGKYIKCLITDINPLDGFIKSFAALLIEIKKEELYLDNIDFIMDFLQTDEKSFREYIVGNDYIKNKDRVWQNYFSLVIISGFRAEALSYLTYTLIACNYLETVVKYEESNDVEKSSRFGFDAMRQIANANILLPDLFPLPGFQDSASELENFSSVAPYAIGDLQLVRKKLERYEAGDLADILCLMPGERKKMVDRNLRQSYDEQIFNSSNNREDQNISDESNTDFISEVSNVLADNTRKYHYHKLDSTYGPPAEIKFNGNVTTDRQYLNPKQKSKTDFAKNIVSKAKQNITSKISKSRVHAIQKEHEQTSISTFDHRNGTKPIHGLYYWINKIYKAQLVNYGNRFILNFMIEDPARRLKAISENFDQENITKPVSPKKAFGISSFEDVTRKNYARLCSQYGVVNINTPPEKYISISVTLEGDQSKIVNIPEGYVARRAFLTFVLTKNMAYPTVKGMVGPNTFTFNKPQDKVMILDLDNQRNSMAISASFDFAALPSQPVGNVQTGYQIGIEIKCACNRNSVIMQQWRIDMYRKIIKGYKRQLRRFKKRTEMIVSGEETRNPLRSKNVVSSELKKSCISVIFGVIKKKVGLDKLPIKTPNNDPYTLEFIQDAIEWEQMTYSLIEGPDIGETGMGSGDQDFLHDDLLSAFIQAKSARILVPVTPRESFRIYYLLLTGTIWNDATELVPALKNNLSLFYALKTANLNQTTYASEIQEEWTVLLPTTMKMLHQTSSSDLTIKCYENEVS